MSKAELDRLTSEYIQKIINNPPRNFRDFSNGIPRPIQEALTDDWTLVVSRGYQFVCKFLEAHRHYAVLGHLQEFLFAGQYFAPGIVEAAEFYEKAGQLKKALKLYQDGIEKCDPYRLETYDEKTGGSVAVMGNKFAEGLYAKEIEEGFRHVEICRKKVKELAKKLRALSYRGRKKFKKSKD